MAPECYALIVAMSAWNVVWCGSFNNPPLSFPDISTKYEKAENGLETSYETASVCQRTTILPWRINNWFCNLCANCKNMGFFFILLNKKKRTKERKSGFTNIRMHHSLSSSIPFIFLCCWCLMNSECLISSLLSFAVGKHFPLWLTPYLAFL